jgi:hypothetical protein
VKTPMTKPATRESHEVAVGRMAPAALKASRISEDTGAVLTGNSGRGRCHQPPAKLGPIAGLVAFAAGMTAEAAPPPPRKPQQASTSQQRGTSS